MARKIMLLSIVSLLIYGCGTSDVNTIFFDVVTVDKTVKLSNDEGSPVCSVHLDVAYATEKNGHKADVINEIIQNRLLDMSELTMKQAVDSFANSYTESYIRNFLPLYNQDRADTTKRSWYEYHYVMTCKTQGGGMGTSCYLATIDYFEGGAHGVNMLKTILFDNTTGNELTLDNLFLKGYEKPLSAILTKALQEKMGVKDKKALREMGFLKNMEMFPSKNFLLNDETITFIYNPDEIASYDQGSTEITIALSALDRLLKKEYKQ